eukprot:scaffold103_cov193-Alexandrium_tamarense.AAC.4
MVFIRKGHLPHSRQIKDQPSRIPDEILEATRGVVRKRMELDNHSRKHRIKLQLTYPTNPFTIMWCSMVV